jgi:type II secretion system protein N
MRKRITEYKYFMHICYLLVFFLAAFVFIYLTFPAEDLERRVVYEIESRTPLKADIETVSVSPIFGVNAYNINLYRLDKQLLKIEKLEVKQSVFALFSESCELPFHAEILGGEAEGILTYNSKSEKLEAAEAEVSGVDMEKVASILPDAFGKRNPVLQGSLNGSFAVKLGSSAQGDFDFKIKGLGISNIEVRNFPMPAFSNLESTFKGRMENNITQVEQLEFLGDDIDLKLSGTMPLLWKVHRGGKIDLKFRLRSSGEKLNLLRAFLAPQRDGTLGGKLVGTVHSPRVVLPQRGSL